MELWHYRGYAFALFYWLVCVIGMELTFVKFLEPEFLETRL